jgi:hypothetical protein
LFLVELSACLQNLHKRSGTLRKKKNSTRGHAEIHIQRPIFYNKNSI